MRHKAAFKRKKESKAKGREISRSAFYPSDNRYFAYILGGENLADGVVI